MGHVNLFYNFSAYVVVVPGKFNIAFLFEKEKWEEKKIVIMRPVIFISIAGKKKKFSLVSFNLFCLEFVCVYERWEKKNYWCHQRKSN